MNYGNCRVEYIEWNWKIGNWEKEKLELKGKLAKERVPLTVFLRRRRRRRKWRTFGFLVRPARSSRQAIFTHWFIVGFNTSNMFLYLLFHNYLYTYSLLHKHPYNFYFINSPIIRTNLFIPRWGGIRWRNGFVHSLLI